MQTLLQQSQSESSVYSRPLGTLQSHGEPRLPLLLALDGTSHQAPEAPPATLQVVSYFPCLLPKAGSPGPAPSQGSLPNQPPRDIQLGSGYQRAASQLQETLGKPIPPYFGDVNANCEKTVTYEMVAPPQKAAAHQSRALSLCLAAPTPPAGIGFTRHSFHPS